MGNTNNMMNEEEERLRDKQEERLNEDDTIVCGPESLTTEPCHLDDEIQAQAKLITRHERSLYKSCAVAGTSFHNIDDIWDMLSVGTEIVLVRDKKNEYDKNAVAVALANDYDDDPDNFNFDFILGYIPKTENEHIAMLLDMGWIELFECEISELNEHSHYGNRLHINIYIRSKYEVTEDYSNRLRVLTINLKTYKKITSDIITRGNTYFRWGGFPHCEHNLPTTNDNVVFIHKSHSVTEFFLMRLIAIGDEAEPFVENGEELYMTDDRCHYVFTNVKGPILINKTYLEFLDNEVINDSQPEIYLSKEASDKLWEIIENSENPT